MKATELFRTRIVHTECAFAELVLWRVPVPVKGSLHEYKYRLAYVVKGICVVRYNNEVGKGNLISKEAQPREVREADLALPDRQLVPVAQGWSEGANRRLNRY